MDCQNQKENLDECPCTYPSCPRKGKCCECLQYHLARKELPACCFSKKTEASYNRSFQKFIEENKQA